MCGAGRLILVVDDDPVDRRKTIAILTNAGFRAVEASTAVEGITAVLTLGPDLVLVDYAMPEVNGYDVISAMRAIEGIRSTPVIVLSAWQSDTVRQRCRGLGALWLDKAASAGTLVKMVERSIGAMGSG